MEDLAAEDGWRGHALVAHGGRQQHVHQVVRPRTHIVVDGHGELHVLNGPLVLRRLRPHHGVHAQQHAGADLAVGHQLGQVRGLDHLEIVRPHREVILVVADILQALLGVHVLESKRRSGRRVIERQPRPHGQAARHVQIARQRWKLPTLVAWHAPAELDTSVAGAFSQMMRTASSSFAAGTQVISSTRSGVNSCT